MRVKNFLIHRKEQWDLDNLKPLLCIHKTYDKGDAIQRIFCLGVKNRKIVFILKNPFKYRF